MTTWRTWLFTRGAESVRMVARRQVEHEELLVAGPREVRLAYRFDSAEALLAFQATLHRQFTASGFRWCEETDERRHPRKHGPSDRLSCPLQANR